MLGTRGSNHLRLGTTVYDDIRNLLFGNIFGLKCNPYYFLCLSKIYAIWDSLPGFSQSSNRIYSSLIQLLAIGSGSCFPSEKISSTLEKVTFAITMKVPQIFELFSLLFFFILWGSKSTNFSVNFTQPNSNREIHTTRETERQTNQCRTSSL